MAKDPGFGYKVKATVISAKGTCSAGHKEGDTFDISCHNPDGLCGFFYHDIFPTLSTFQFGGNLPWWEGKGLTGIDKFQLCLSSMFFELSLVLIYPQPN